MRRSDRTGFSLVEIAMVLIILGLIVTVVMPPLVESIKREKRSAAKSSLNALRDAVIGYALQNNVLPSVATLGGIALLRDQWQHTVLYNPDSYLVNNDICAATGADLTDMDNVVTPSGTVSDVAFILASNGHDGNRDITVTPAYDITSPGDDLVLYLTLNQLKGAMQCGGDSASSSTGSTTSTDTVLPTGSVAAFEFETTDSGTVTDATNDLTGTLSGDVTTTYGKTGNGLSFDGSNDYVKIAADPSLNLTTNGTLMAWVYLTGFHEWMGIIHKGDSTSGTYFNDEAYSLQFYSDRRILLLARINNTSNNEYIYTNTPNTYVPLNQWTHVAGVWDPDGMRIYFNGVQVREDTTKTPVCRITDGDVQIGSQGDSTSGWGTLSFEGVIDGVGIYPRTVSQAEIQAYYDATKDAGL
ncbi:MAG: LamG-like jellyroll fold domain-containing protein [Desulfovibrionaceae bacterium]